MSLARRTVLPPVLRGARAAVVFLTRIPAGGFPYTEHEWAWSSGWFPLVGAAVGAAMALVWSATRWAGPPASAVLTLLAGLLLTGAFHEDGLADSADALGGATSRERLFAILKDSRIGTFGALALVLTVLLRLALYVELGARVPWALLLSQTLSRAAPVWLMCRLPYVTPESQAKSTAVCRAGPGQAALASLWPALLLGLAVAQGACPWRQAPIVLLGTGLTTVALGHWFRARAGGVTGDFLGATQQLCECVILLCCVHGMGSGT